MATDRALLDSIETIDGPCFRHYQWEKPVWSFGYSQRLHEVCSTLNQPLSSNNLVRRPTGGGIVDHTNDWTYTLALPAHHALAQSKAATSYQAIHQAITNALQSIHIAANLSPCLCGESRKPGVCFKEPVAYDVLGKSGKKIAGAAQKRTRAGLLIQGSIDRLTLGNQEDGFHQAFIRELETMLDAKAKPWEAPKQLLEAIDTWEKVINSKEWLHLR